MKLLTLISIITFFGISYAVFASEESAQTEETASSYQQGYHQGYYQYSDPSAKEPLDPLELFLQEESSARKDYRQGVAEGRRVKREQERDSWLGKSGGGGYFLK